MFELSKEEYDALRRHFGTLKKRGKHSKYLPYAFTEQGVAMLSSVLRSKRAVQVNIAIMRAFVKLREMVAAHKELAGKLAELERRVASHDGHIKSLFDAIRQLMEPAKPRPRRIGFQARTWQRAAPNHAALRSQNATLARGRGQHRKYVPSHEVTMSTYR